MRINLQQHLRRRPGQGDVKRLRELGVRFTMDPAAHGPVRLAIFADTCGNLIQIYQRVG